MRWARRKIHSEVRRGREMFVYSINDTDRGGKTISVRFMRKAFRDRGAGAIVFARRKGIVLCGGLDGEEHAIG